jgi:uncharacterized membrane protein
MELEKLKQELEGVMAMLALYTSMRKEFFYLFSTKVISFPFTGLVIFFFATMVYAREIGISIFLGLFAALCATISVYTYFRSGLLIQILSEEKTMIEEEIEKMK